MRPSQLASILSVPGTDEPVFLRVLEIDSGGEPYSGWVEDSGGRVWGRLSRFKYNFNDFAPVQIEERHSASTGPTLALVPESWDCDLSDSRFVFRGDWFKLSDFLLGCDSSSNDSYLEFEADCPRVDLKFHSHPWSGIVEIFRDGKSIGDVDLYNESVAITRGISVENVSGGKMLVTVKPSGRKSPTSLGKQMIIEGIKFVFPQTRRAPTYSGTQAVNRGGRFNPRFLELMAVCAAELNRDPVILDVGGGKRHLGFENYINLEYSAYDEPDIYGDALELPFRSNSIDLVYSAAVLEHVRNPAKVGCEVYRVVKRGGRGLLNSAFMQPVHSEGQHFFNLTPYAIDMVAGQFSDRKVSWEGSLSDTLIWMLKVSGVEARASSSEYEAFIRMARNLDGLVTYDKLMYIASGVWVEVRKG
jgi:SAM-dependent methyltransferase